MIVEHEFHLRHGALSTGSEEPPEKSTVQKTPAKSPNNTTHTNVFFLKDETTSSFLKDESFLIDETTSRLKTISRLQTISRIQTMSAFNFNSSEKVHNQNKKKKKDSAFSQYQKRKMYRKGAANHKRRDNNETKTIQKLPKFAVPEGAARIGPEKYRKTK